jgi:hypothetical protein
MAIVARANGDSQVVINVGDSVTKNANATIINTGIASPIKAYKISTLGTSANLAAELSRGLNGNVGAVDVLLSTVSGNATVLAYQVDTNGTTSQLSVIVERSGWSSDTAIRDAVRALGSNIGSKTEIDCSSATVTSTGGIKFA